MSKTQDLRTLSRFTLHRVWQNGFGYIDHYKVRAENEARAFVEGLAVDEREGLAVDERVGLIDLED